MVSRSISKRTPRPLKTRQHAMARSIPSSIVTRTHACHGTLMRLHALGAPDILLRLIVGLAATLPSATFVQDGDSVEYFAGQMEVSQAMARAGLKAYFFELLRDNVMMDILGDKGFCYAVLLALKLRPGGFCMLAPVCSSWVFMNRGTSGRSRSSPVGRRDVPSVQ